MSEVDRPAGGDAGTPATDADAGTPPTSADDGPASGPFAGRSQVDRCVPDPTTEPSKSARTKPTLRSRGSVRSRFRRAQRSASLDRSRPRPWSAGNRWRSASRIAPLPVPTSTSRGAWIPAHESSFGSIRALSRSTRTSVSGLGMRTPGPTSSSSSQNGTVPSRYWRGSLAARRARSDSRRSSAAGSREEAKSSRRNARESIPSAARSSSRASTSGASDWRADSRAQRQRRPTVRPRNWRSRARPCRRDRR